MTPPFIAFEVRAGFNRPLIRFEGPHREAQLLLLWERVWKQEDAGVWGITADGFRFGTLSWGGFERGAGSVSRCVDCQKEFLAPEPNASHCPGCAVSVRPAEFVRDNGGIWCPVAGLGKPHFFREHEPDRCAWCLKSKKAITLEGRT